MSIINYVTNSGFESGLTGWTTSWTVGLNSTYSHTGSNSAQVAGGTSGSYIYKLVSVPDSNSFQLMVVCVVEERLRSRTVRRYRRLLFHDRARLSEYGTYSHGAFPPAGRYGE